MRSFGCSNNISRAKLAAPFSVCKWMNENYRASNWHSCQLLGSVRFCSQWAFRHAPLSHVPLCVTWAFCFNALTHCVNFFNACILLLILHLEATGMTTDELVLVSQNGDSIVMEQQQHSITWVLFFFFLWRTLPERSRVHDVAPVRPPRSFSPRRKKTNVQRSQVRLYRT